MKRFLLLPLLAMLIGCGPASIQVKVTNYTDRNIEQVIVSTSSGNSYLEINDLDAGSTALGTLKFGNEKADGSYQITVQELELSQSFGYHTSGSPLESEMNIAITDHELKCEFSD